MQWGFKYLDYVSGFHRENDDGSTTLENGRLPLFQNFDEHGNPFGRPRTLLIDSVQLESGDALDRKFRDMASDEIDRFRREITERTGDRQQAENITDQDLLREVMNTIGKPGKLGEHIRCVVSFRHGLWNEQESASSNLRAFLYHKER